MLIKRIIIFFILAVIFGSFKSCKTVTRLSRQNLDFLYDETKLQLNPDYLVFHHSNDSSTLFYKISSDELHYARDSEKEIYTANYKIHYRLLDSFTANVVTDSLTVFLSDTSLYKSGLSITDSVILSIPGSERYIMQLTMTDINSQAHSTNLLKINKTGDNNFQYFKIYYTNDNNDKTLMFSPFISQSGNYILRYKEDIFQKAGIKVYTKPQPVAPPPFFDEPLHFPEMKPDKVFQIAFEKGVADLPFETAGLYKIDLESEAAGGALLYYFDDNQMLLPLRYLTSSKEFEDLISHPDPEDAVDIFWTTMAGTHLRGKKTVDIFYDNVKKSNEHFTTWKEGWKTDRGMIYTVFGTPDRVIKDDNSEKWVYYGTWRVPDTEFNFRKIDAPFGITCYELERKPEYRHVWFHAVERIRR